jgi:hypothetical protein
MGCTSYSQLKIYLGEAETKVGYLGRRLWAKLKGRWVSRRPGIGRIEEVPKEAEEENRRKVGAVGEQGTKCAEEAQIVSGRETIMG